VGAFVFSDRFSQVRAAGIEASAEQVKALYLYNFSVFIEWPTNKFAKTNSPIVIGVLADRDVETELGKIARKVPAGSRPLLIRRLTANADFTECHIVFIGHDQRLDPVLAKLKSVQGILTVAEHEQFGQRGGMINIVLDEDQLRYEINRVATEKAGLKPSAQLIRHALKVIASEPDKGVR
jgi:hypothetical protein